MPTAGLPRPLLPDLPLALLPGSPQASRPLFLGKHLQLHHLESKAAAGGQETNGRAVDHPQPTSGLVIDKDFEVYQMLEEKRIT